MYFRVLDTILNISNDIVYFDYKPACLSLDYYYVYSQTSRINILTRSFFIWYFSRISCYYDNNNVLHNTRFNLSI